MQTNRFNALVANIKANVSGDQIIALEHVVREMSSIKRVEISIARQTEAVNKSRMCPHCKSICSIKHGMDKNGRQRFKCKDCTKTYNVLTGTHLARARKMHLWGVYVPFLDQHTSINNIKRSGIDISRTTIWRWRHRFLRQIAQNDNKLLSGIVEADETYFLENLKGKKDWRDVGRPRRVRAGAPSRGLSFGQKPVLVAVDNTGLIFQTVLEDRQDVVRAFTGRIEAGSLLVTDYLNGYAKVAAASGAEHRQVVIRKGFSASPINQGSIGLGRVSAYQERLKNLINQRCRGVATHNLPSYLGWAKAIKDRRDLLAVE